MIQEEEPTTTTIMESLAAANESQSKLQEAAETPTTTSSADAAVVPTNQADDTSIDNPTKKCPLALKDEEGWKELMGRDLRMKTLAKASGEDRSDAAIDKEGGKPIQHGDLVLIDILGRQAVSPHDDDNDTDSSLGPVFHQAQNWWIVVGDKDVVPALEMGIRFAHEGETIVIWSTAKYAYGFGTRRHYHSNNTSSSPAAAVSQAPTLDGTKSSPPQQPPPPQSATLAYELPPESSVRYDVTIRRVVTNRDRAASPCPEEWILTLAESKKNIGNDAYAHEWSNGYGKGRILYIYQKAAKELQWIVDHPEPFPDELQEEEEEQQQKDDDQDETKNSTNSQSVVDKTNGPEDADAEQRNQEPPSSSTATLRQKARSMLLDCLNNIVAVQLRAKEYHAAKAAAVQVLGRDAYNFKGLIRAAKAALLDPASSYEEVNAAIRAASEHAVNNNNSNNSSNNNDPQQQQQNKNDLAALRREFQKQKLAYEQKSKEMYTKALRGVGGGKSSQPSSHEENNASPQESQTATTTTRGNHEPSQQNDDNNNDNKESSTSLFS